MTHIFIGVQYLSGPKIFPAFLESDGFLSHMSYFLMDTISWIFQ